MKKIIAFSGKKNSGKNACANFVFGNFLKQTNMIKDYAVNEETDGKLVIQTIDDKEGIFYIDDRTPAIREYLEEQIYPVMRPFYLADAIKETCIILFGLDPKLVYGNNEEKDTLTKYTWEQFYNLIGVTQCEEYPNSGFMTIREILKFFGTEVLRKRFDPAIHTDRTLEKIELANSEYAYILDVRFPDEVEAIQAAGGKVIRLTKKTFDDQHESETALDDYPLEKYDAVIDNHNQTIEETFRELLEILDGWECI